MVLFCLFSQMVYSQDLNKTIKSSDINIFAKKTSQMSHFLLDLIRENYLFSEKVDFFDQEITNTEVKAVKLDKGIKEFVNNEFGRLFDAISPVEIKGMQTYFDVGLMHYKVLDPKVTVEYTKINKDEILITAYLKTNRLEFSIESLFINNYTSDIILEKIGDKILITNPEKRTAIDDIYGQIFPKLNKPILVLQGDGAIRAKIEVVARLSNKANVSVKFKTFKIESIFDIKPKDFKFDDYVDLNISDDSGIKGFVGVQAGQHNINYNQAGFLNGINTHKSLIASVLNTYILDSLNDSSFKKDLQEGIDSKNFGEFSIGFTDNLSMEFKLDNLNYLKSYKNEFFNVGFSISDESDNSSINTKQYLKDFDENSKFNAMGVISLNSVNKYLQKNEQKIYEYLELEKERIIFGPNGVKVYVKDGKLFCATDIIYKEKFFKRVAYAVATGKSTFRIPVIAEIDFVYNTDKSQLDLKVVEVVKDRDRLEKSTAQYKTNLNKGWLKKRIHKEVTKGLSRLENYIFYELKLNKKKQFDLNNVKIKYNKDSIIFYGNLNKEDALYYTLIDQFTY
jgi:hypothetical protein